MPSQPSFDYYTELKVGLSASAQDVTSSYRRLALIHHPDRNPDGQGEATARFQRLQLAYETLSDPAKRARYDNSRQAPLSPFDDFDDGHDNDDDIGDDEVVDAYAFFSQFGFGFPGYGGFRPFGSGRPRATNSYRWTRYDDMEYQEMRAEMEEEMKWRQRGGKPNTSRQKDGSRSEVSDRSQRKAERAAKLNTEAVREEAEKNARREEEQQKQQQRWKDANAVTKDERHAACLHSDFCQKVQQQTKFKCSACSAKRGRLAFECPYCSAFLCQLCITKFSNWRGRLSRSDEPKPTGTAEETQDHVDPDIDSKAATATDATSAKPASPQKTSQGKAGKASPHRPADGTDTMSGTANNGKDKKAEGRSEEPDNHETSNLSENVTPGATRGFIRNTQLGRGAPLALLRRAMEQFGAVVSLKITNRRAGNAHVEFADHDGLYKAMAASPVAVTDHGAVDVVELKECGGCGKFGHVIGKCNGAKAPGSLAPE